MSNLFGKTTGCCRGEGGSMHMFSKEHNVLGGFAFIGDSHGRSLHKQISALKEANCDHVTLALFGDGTCNNGQLFECLNMAASWKLPIVFVVENKRLGCHIWGQLQIQRFEKRDQLSGCHVDGMDVLKVREFSKEAIGRARRGEGPTLVECETYRLRGHSLADPDELRHIQVIS